MATHASILAWEIPWTEEPGGLQSLRLQRVRGDLNDNSVHVTCAEKEGLCVWTEMLKGEGTCPAGNC